MTEPVTIGRDEGDLVLGDPAASRRHAMVMRTTEGLVIDDLGSSNGTLVNDVRITGPTVLQTGDRIRLGDTEVDVALAASPVGPAGRATAAPSHSPPGSPIPDPTTAPPQSRPGDASEANEAVEVRFRRSSAAADAVSSYLSAARRARQNLEGIGSESWGSLPVIHLVDPFPDPADPEHLVTSGALVDGANGQAWVVVTAEAPPEDPHRTLAVLFGHALPNAERLGPLLEGYGLHRAHPDGPDPMTGLEIAGLADLDEAEGDARAAMTTSFVRFLVEREGDEGLRRMLGAPTGQLDATVRTVYGASLPQLEDQWRREVATGEPEVSPADFLRLSWRYLRPYKRRQAEIFGYMLLSLAFTAAFPFVTRQLFDSAIPSGELSQVLTLLAGLGFAFVVSVLAEVRQTYQSAWITGAVTRDLRSSTFERLQRLPARWYQDHPQGDVLSRLFSDVGQVQVGLTSLISDGIFQVMTLGVSAAIMLQLNPLLGAIVLVAAPLVAFVYRRMSNGAQKRSMAVQESNGGLLRVAAENYSANPVVRVFGLAGREGRRFDQQSERLFRAQRRLSLFTGMFGLSVNLIVTILRLVVLGFGAWLILQGNFTVGGLVAFLAVVGEVLGPVTLLTGLGQDLQASMGSLIRVNEVLDAETEPGEKALPPVAPLQRELTLSDVGFAYSPAKRALSGVDVTIRAGSRVAFVGPSGSGKSTILRLLMRLYEPDEGSIQVDGADLRDHSLNSWRDQVGVVFQDSFLFDATVAENIALGKTGATEAEVRAAADAAEVDSFISRLDGGYDSVVGEGGQNLSGGQRQRVAIARALIRNPSVLLLDEATSALDPRTERQITETLRHAAQGRTVVAITHRLTSIADFDHIVVIDDGKVCEQGTHAELLADGGLYAAMWFEQTGDDIPVGDARATTGDDDLRKALARIVLFEDLDRAALDDVGARLRPFTLSAGETMADPSGLVVLHSGRGHVLVRGGQASGATLAPGDAFGVVALLGGEPSTLCADTDLALGQLDAEDIDALAAVHPSIAERLRSGQRVVVPAHSTRLGRLTTMGPQPLDSILTGEARP